MQFKSGLKYWSRMQTVTVSNLSPVSFFEFVNMVHTQDCFYCCCCCCCCCCYYYYYYYFEKNLLHT